jgi:hypothetical protein
LRFVELTGRVASALSGARIRAKATRGGGQRPSHETVTDPAFARPKPIAHAHLGANRRPGALPAVAELHRARGRINDEDALVPSGRPQIAFVGDATRAPAVDGDGCFDR